MWQGDLQKVREDANARRLEEAGREQDRTHTEVLAWLRDLGLAFGYRVHLAATDRARALGAGQLGDGVWPNFPFQSLDCRARTQCG